MRIVNRKHFLAHPRGTIYQKYMPCVIESHLSIKGDTFENDWWLQPLNGVDAGMAELGKDPSVLNLNSEVRDGEFDDTQLFLVFEEHEVVMLLERIHQALLDFCREPTIQEIYDNCKELKNNGWRFATDKDMEEI